MRRLVQGGLLSLALVGGGCAGGPSSTPEPVFVQATLLENGLTHFAVRPAVEPAQRQVDIVIAVENLELLHVRYTNGDWPQLKGVDLAIEGRANVRAWLTPPTDRNTGASNAEPNPDDGANPRPAPGPGNPSVEPNPDDGANPRPAPGPGNPSV